MGGIFRTIGNTFNLIKMSWRVLQLDRELIVFPILSGLGVLVIAGIAAGVFGGIGTLDRIGQEGTQLNLVDVIITVVVYFASIYVIIFCNAALIAAARERLEGGDPNVASGFRAVRGMWLAILGWTLITGTVGLILRALQAAAQSSDNQMMRIVGSIIVSMVGAVWAYITFFVVPVLVAERVGPIQAIRRSSSYFKRSWGEQLTAQFSFMLIYIVALLIAAIPVIILAFIWPILAIIAAVILGGIAIATVAAMEGIFKAALYEWVAEGKSNQWFDEQLLRDAWAP